MARQPAQLRPYRVVLFFAVPLLFMLLLPLYIGIDTSEDLYIVAAPGVALLLLSFVALLIDQTVHCSISFPLVHCTTELVLLLFVLNMQAVPTPGHDILPRPASPSDAETAAAAAVAAAAAAAATTAAPAPRVEVVRPQPPRAPSKFLEAAARPQAQLAGAGIGAGKLSIVLPCASEGDYAVKTVQSFCNRTPSEVLQEIIVVDDGTVPPLAPMFAGVGAHCKLRILRHEETLGLMIAKQTGGDAALGDFIGFFDCHVAPNRGWHVEIIEKLKESSRRLVVPAITDLSIDMWDEKPHSAVQTKCYVDWNADFMWYDDDTPYIPIISGGLVATTKEWWHFTGGFDKEMRGWGGENIDQSLQAWLCGGDIVRATSSRIAHMWRIPEDPRTRVRYHHHHHADNKARVAAAWFGDFLVKYQNGVLLKSPPDVSKVSRRIKAMKCKPFAYLLHRFRRVYVAGGVIPGIAFRLRSDRGKCIQRSSTHFRVGECGSGSSMFHEANQDPGKKGKCCSGIRQWNTLDCFDRFDDDGPLVYFCDLTGHNANQQWHLREDGRLEHGSGACLSHDDHGALRKEHKCEAANTWTKTDFELPLESKLYQEAVQKYGFTDDIPDS